MLAAASTTFTVILIVLIVFAVTIFFKTIRIVPQKQACIVERLGKYYATLEAGLHMLIPFLDKIAYKHTLKEQAVDVPPQQCITKDNIAVEVDGILYMQVVDAKKASYGIDHYRFDATQLALQVFLNERTHGTSIHSKGRLVRPELMIGGLELGSVGNGV